MDTPFDNPRATAIGRALGAIPESVYEAGGRVASPRPALPRICEFPPPFAVLTGLAIALSNYQLGRGGSPQYWRDVADGLDRHGPITDEAGLWGFIRDLMRRPSASRLASRKLARIERLLRSPLPAWLAERSIAEVGSDCMSLWDGVAGAMRQPREAKTIAYAIRIFDVMHKIATGRYVTFAVPVPIVVDLRIGRVSLASGLMGVTDPSDVLRLMEDADRYVAMNGRAVLAAWNAVGESTGGLSLFRIDGLLWEVGETIHRERHRRTDAQVAVTAMLRAHGADETAAIAVAAALTKALPNA